MNKHICLTDIVAAEAGHAVDLDANNFDEIVKNSGKNAFVKFLAPW